VHAALVRADERTADDVSRPVLQPDVVERELQRLSRALDEGRDLSRNFERGLPAVGEGMNLDQGRYRSRRAAVVCTGRTSASRSSSTVTDANVDWSTSRAR
jgi:hypothetical protein